MAVFGLDFLFVLGMVFGGIWGQHHPLGWGKMGII